MSLDLVDSDSLIHIIQYCQAEEAARVGLCNEKWNDKIFQGGKLWKTFATTRWGDGISLVDSDEEQSTTSYSWYEYYRHRCSWMPLPGQKSKLDLIQEDYGHDPYKLLSACILCSRTSGSQTVKDVVKAFFDKYKTPSDILSGDIATIEKELKPLGLNREKTMKKFAQEFLRPWTQVSELHGCGAFASSSFDIFCRGDFKKVLREKKCDKNVRAYASYLKRVVDQTDEEDDVADNSNAAGKVKRKAKQKKTQTRKRVTLSTTKGPRRKSPRGC
eukprot:scaffold2563_cov139-Skeletonema_marinoi.AAC.5